MCGESLSLSGFFLFLSRDLRQQNWQIDVEVFVMIVEKMYFVSSGIYDERTLFYFWYLAFGWIFTEASIWYMEICISFKFCTFKNILVEYW